ncbi:MAG: universal stress protein [Maricaulaceae bacterium]|jgi:nucleotide-binding universal stress UspA family protein
MTDSIRAILAPLVPPGDETVLLPWGKRLGDDLGATVDAAYVREDWKQSTRFVSDFAFYMSDAVLDELEETARQSESRARDAFEEAAEHAAKERFGRFIRVTDRFDAALARTARCFDLALSVAPADPVKQARDGVLEALLIGGGVPVFSVPATLASDAPLETALVAWNGSAPAARALRASIPFLKRAKVVHVARFGAEGADDNDVSAPIAYLSAHDIEADASQLGQTGGGVGDAIIEHAAKIEADLIVMGAYGRARWMEHAVGGVTRRVLTRTEMPLLLAH